jgi:hypothetical protein
LGFELFSAAILGAAIAGALHLPTSVFFGLFSGHCCYQPWSALQSGG